MDYGPEPFVTKIDWEAKQNNNYRTAFWTGENLQLMLMCVGEGQKTDLEIHDTDHFVRIEEGQGIVETGDKRNNLDFRVRVSEGYAIMIPAGIWHTVSNIGNTKLRLYVIYAPPQYPHGTINETGESEQTIYEKNGQCVINPTTSIKTIYLNTLK
ncbi:MAG: cupin domain-containing protein [Anaerotignaceae bacterium]